MPCLRPSGDSHGRAAMQQEVLPQVRRDHDQGVVTTSHEQNHRYLSELTEPKEDLEMPRGDRTGPRGMGPMTGRAAGYCAGNDAPGYASPGFGRGYGGGAGRGYGGGGGGYGGGGRGWRNMYHATGLPGWARYGGYAAPYPYPATYAEPDPELQKQALKNQADALQAQLDMVMKRLADLEPEATKK